MSEPLTVEDAIAAADALAPRPPVEVVAQLGSHERRHVARTAMARTDLKAAAVEARLTPYWVEDHRCHDRFTVIGYIVHSGHVQHEPGDVVPAEVEIDERDRGRGGESKTAAWS